MERLMHRAADKRCIVLSQLMDPVGLADYLDSQGISWIALNNLLEIAITWRDWLNIRFQVEDKYVPSSAISEVPVKYLNNRVAWYSVKYGPSLSSITSGDNYRGRDLVVMPNAAILIDSQNEELIFPENPTLVRWQRLALYQDSLGFYVMHGNADRMKSDLRAIYFRDLVPAIDSVILKYLADGLWRA